MSDQKKRGRPAGEVQVGEGFDEKLKRLAELFAEREWTFGTVSRGTIDASGLSRVASEQEADQQADRNAWSRYQQVHEPVMRRQGERGALYASALALARAASKGNRDLLRLLAELQIRPGGHKRPSKSAANAAPA